MFLTFKQEASGWPCDSETEDDKLKYIANFEKREEVKLDYKNIVKNPGLRAVLKLCMNCFWGKFGQRPNLPQTTRVRIYQELLKLLTDPEIYV